MKMKSRLFGNGAKLALTLLAMCGMFASCYEKDEIDVPKVTDPTATTYQVAGIVTDAESNAVMDGVTVTNVTNSKSMTTAADGKYVLEAKVGEPNVVTFAKSGYKTVTSSVFVTKQENGSIVAYTIDAKMEKGKETKPTKEVEYQIEGSVFDAESGEPVAIKTATMPGILTATIQNGNEFTMSNVGLGQHTIYITADGYKPATADVVISEVAGPEGEGIFIAKTSVTVAMQKKEVEVAPKYYLAGNIYNQDGGMVTKAEVTLNMSGYEVTTTASNGFYKFEIPADKVKGLTKATVTIRHNSYKIYVYTAFIAPVDNGQVSNTTVNVTLILKPDTEKPNDDDNVFIGGNVEIEVPTENAVEAAPEKAEEETALEEKIEEYNHFLTASNDMFTVEALEEAMQKVMDNYAGGISTHYQFNEKQLALAKDKIKQLIELSEDVAAEDMHELMFVYELRERLTVCLAVIAHLEARKETRWHSFAENLDYPKKDRKWLKYVNSRMEDGEIIIRFRDLVGREEHYEHSN